METNANAEVLARELSKTEIEIAAAQIADRFSRVISAQATAGKEYLKKDMETEEWTTDEWTPIETAIRQRFEIPQGVHLFDIDESADKADFNKVKPYIKHWVAGRLTEDEMCQMYWQFEECGEVDYLWVFLEKPAHFYGTGDSEQDKGPDIDALRKEWMSIGTRSRKKHSGAPFEADWSLENPRPISR